MAGLTARAILTFAFVFIATFRNTFSADVRLVNEFGSATYKGRVEVYHADVWGTVCDDGWDINDADVVCRQLGFTGAIRALKRAYYGAANSNSIIWLDQVACQGDESRIQDCASSGWSNHDCVHIEDASVECSNASVRMIEGSDRYEGNVQLLHEGSWSYVCDNEWDDVDASVACRQFDSREADVALNGSYYGTKSGPLLISDMDCAGNEAKLEQCSNSGWSNSSLCKDSDKAGVSCTRDATEDGSVRLVGTGNPNKGRVEIYHNGEWGTVCDDYWDYYDAKVVCRQLGYANAQAKAFYNSYFGEGQGRIWLDNVACYGSESRLEDCLTMGGWGYHDCYHSEDAGVYCDLKGEFDAAEITGIVLGSLIALSILGCCVKLIFFETAASKRHQRRRRGRTQRNRPTSTPTSTPEEHFDAHFNSAYTISGEQTDIITPEGFLRPPPFSATDSPSPGNTELPPTYEFVLAHPISKGNSGMVPPPAGAASLSTQGAATSAEMLSAGASVAVLPTGAAYYHSPQKVNGAMLMPYPNHNAPLPEQCMPSTPAMMPPVENRDISSLPYPPQSGAAAAYPPPNQPTLQSSTVESNEQTHENNTCIIRDTSNATSIAPPTPAQVVANPQSASNACQEVKVDEDTQNPSETTVNLGHTSDGDLSDV